MKILQFTDNEDFKILTKKLPKVITEEDYRIAGELKNTMFQLCIENNGIGLSSNQIGIEKRFFVIHTKSLKDIFINPVIEKGYGDKVSSTEGCLSFANGKKGFKKRYKKIDVLFEDENKIKYRMNLNGLESIVFQHELDHMNGIVI